MRIAGFVVALVLACFAAGLAQAEPLTLETARKRVSVKDNALEVAVTFTTRDVGREKRNLMGMVPLSVFLRAFVDKASGATRFQVYAQSSYLARYRANWAWVNYETPAGPKAAELDVLARLRGRCSQYLGCARHETVAFFVDEPLLRTAAAGPGAAWSFKLKARDGSERIEAIAAAEIAGLLAAVDDYRASRGFAP